MMVMENAVLGILNKLKSRTFMRVYALAGAAFVGGFLAFQLRSMTCANDISCIIIGFVGDLSKPFASNLSLILLGLPVFFTLWLFRTHDVQRQIDKAQENINKTQESINNSTFLEAARMIVSNDRLSQRVASEQLDFLRNNTGFDKERIDLLSKKASLSDVSPEGLNQDEN